MENLESPSRLEPCLLDDTPPGILDLVAELTRAAEKLGSRLHPEAAASLAGVVRVMNCYYSNLIEGHNTTPREIERALEDNLAASEERRNLQLEARAHIRLQAGIDAQHAAGTLADPASLEFIQWLHREFYQGAPVAMRRTGPGVVMTPGKFRSAPGEDVTVGLHQPPSAAAVQAFMEHFAARFRFASLGAGSRITAIPAAHHRLNYVHPFLDGNGRVSRLASHAMALKAGIGAHGLWSISRGLARGLHSRTEYKSMMNHADARRRGDLDGRGNLSRAALVEFTQWFLAVCLDQVEFMAGLFELETLLQRLQRYVQLREFRPGAQAILEHILLRGEMPRGDAARVSGLKERSARDVLARLLEDGILASQTPKGPVSLRFPVHAVEVLFPSLFPQS